MNIVYTICLSGARNIHTDKFFWFLFMSILSVRKFVNDPIITIVCVGSDSKLLLEKSNIKCDDIIVTEKPFSYSFRQSMMKAESINVMKGKTFVHLDHDTILFKDIPPFIDTIAQSDEKGCVKWVRSLGSKELEARGKHLFPRDLLVHNTNFNPGIFGFTYDSIIRDEYYDTIVKLGKKTKLYIEQESIQDCRQLLEQFTLVIEESLLSKLCEDNSVNCIFMMNFRFKYVDKIWPTSSDHTKFNSHFRKLFNHLQNTWYAEGFIHFIGNLKDSSIVNDARSKLLSILTPSDIVQSLNNYTIIRDIYTDSSFFINQSSECKKNLLSIKSFFDDRDQNILEIIDHTVREINADQDYSALASSISALLSNKYCSNLFYN